MYSGALKASNDYDNYMFYWLFRNSDSSKPLIIWINGGPGASSLFGLFLENGPLRIMKSDDDINILYQEDSWLEAGNLLYIDNPVGSGFSFG
jgi:vitellogenic carboxypeptidase-like protein